MIGRDFPRLVQQGPAGGMSLANRRFCCRQAVCFSATSNDNPHIPITRARPVQMKEARACSKQDTGRKDHY